MADDVELIIQVPRGSPVDRQLRTEPPLSVSSGRAVIERLPADADGRLLPPPAGELILSVLSPEALREADEVRRAIQQAAADGDPLVVVVQNAEQLRDDELAAVLDAAAHTRRVVLLRVMVGSG
jgi:hypothetical protein